MDLLSFTTYFASYILRAAHYGPPFVLHHPLHFEIALAEIIRDHQRPICRHINLRRVKHIGQTADHSISSNHVPGIVYIESLILVFHPTGFLQLPVDREMPVSSVVLKTLHIVLLAPDPEAEVCP